MVNMYVCNIMLKHCVLPMHTSSKGYGGDFQHVSQFKRNWDSSLFRFALSITKCDAISQTPTHFQANVFANYARVTSAWLRGWFMFGQNIMLWFQNIYILFIRHDIFHVFTFLLYYYIFSCLNWLSYLVLFN